jgi:predicted DNA-binding transcriptional regulator YafY
MPCRWMGLAILSELRSDEVQPTLKREREMTQQLIERAILSKAVVSFTYNNNQRIVEPHVLGVSGGVVQLLGFQIGGTSSSGGALPEWRRFDLNRIARLTVTPSVFPGQRPTPSGRHTEWDRVLLVVAA